MSKNFAVVCCLLLVFSACSKSGKPAGAEGPATQSPQTAAAPDPVVMTVNGEQVHQSEYDAALQSLPEQYRAAAAESVDAKRQVAEELVRMKILEQEGKKLGVDKDPKVAAQLNVMRENLIASATMEKLASQKGTDDLQKMYNDNKDAFAAVRVKQILIAYPGSLAKPRGKALSDEEAAAQAASVYQQIKNGASFDQLAKSESADLRTASKGGDLGYLSPQQAPPEIAKVIFSAPVNAVQPPVKTRAGYHIFEVTDKKYRSFDEVKDVLQREAPAIRAQEIAKDLRAKAKVDFDPKFLPAAPAAPAPAPATAPTSSQPQQ